MCFEILIEQLYASMLKLESLMAYDASIEKLVSIQMNLRVFLITLNSPKD